MIKAEGLTKRFDDFTAVSDLNLQISSGQILALLGPNGAGKTTTVRMLSSILKPSEGSAEVAGYDVEKHPSDVRRMVGVLTEHHGLYGRMNANDYLQFFGELYGFSKKEIYQRIDPLLDQLGMNEYRMKRLGEYSKGMRQKLALVRALIHDPPVLLLDEPTSAMDPESAKIVRSAIKQLSNKKRTIILCTHNLSEAEILCDQIAIIQQGKIILNQRLQDIQNSLIGHPIFIAKFSESVSETFIDLPEGIKIHQFNHKDIHFEVPDPQAQNPELIRMLATKYNLVSFEEMPIRLENAYLEAISQSNLRNFDDQAT
ncbi:MAG TPA: ABC transporter ATP-binding protein [Anaerolineaceae bacterium]|nr:ABC transporter ATP-binding protein [Anaerolineaceae bacterium]